MAVNGLQPVELQTVEPVIGEGYTGVVATVGENIRAILVQKGWTQARLADEMGIRQSSVNNMLKRKALPLPDTVEDYARGLGCPVSRLIRDTAYIEVLKRWLGPDHAALEETPKDTDQTLSPLPSSITLGKDNVTVQKPDVDKLSGVVPHGGARTLSTPDPVLAAIDRLEQRIDRLAQSLGDVINAAAIRRAEERGARGVGTPPQSTPMPARLESSEPRERPPVPRRGRGRDDQPKSGKLKGR